VSSGDRIRLEVQERDQVGTPESRRLRAQGLIPGVLYGKGEPRAIAIPERALRAALTGPSGLHAILDVALEGQQSVHPSILKDYQRDPVRGKLVHVDFHEVRLDRPIQASVVVEIVGESVGVKLGGVLSQATREVTIEALPMGIPEHIELDVSSLELGEALRVADLPQLEGVAYLDDPEVVIVSVTAPTREVEPEGVEGAEGEAAPAAEGAEAAEAGAEGEAAEPAGDAGEPDSSEG
jgi:large subunit ribosomal protein L25